MKIALTLLALALTILSVAGDWTGGHNGQSACTGPLEFGQRFQHNLDPTKYWLCDKRGVPATLHNCEYGTAYMHNLRNCLPWGFWQWTAPVDPPSLA